MILQLLQCCVDRGVTVDKICCIDDMEPHMAAMRYAARAFGVPSIGISAYRDPSDGVMLRTHNLSFKHLLVLALPHGGRKLAILNRLEKKLAPTAKVVSWELSGSDEWAGFVKLVLDAMICPGVELVLVKLSLVPDLAKMKTLELFLGRGGTKAFERHGL